MDARTAALLGQKPNVDLRRITPQRVSGGLAAASVGLPSPLGDVIGLLADGVNYASEPSSLTPGAGLLSLAALAPGIPRASAWTRGDGAKDWLLHIADKANEGAISKNGLLPGKDGYVYLWKDGLDADSERIMREARQTRLGLGWDDAGAVPNSYFGVKRGPLEGRIELDPYTGEARVKGAIPPSLLERLDE